MNITYDLQRFGDDDPQTYTTTTQTQTTAAPISTDTTITDTTVILLANDKLVTKTVFDYGLGKMRKYAKDTFFAKTGIMLMGTSDVDTLFAQWEAEDAAAAAAATVESGDGDDTVPAGGGE